MTDKVGGEKLLYCSFCGKSQHEVRKLIAGPSVFICDECIDLCNDIIREEASTDTGQSIEQIERDSDRDRFMGAEEAVEYGLIDKVLKSRTEAVAA